MLELTLLTNPSWLYLSPDVQMPRVPSHGGQHKSPTQTSAADNFACDF